MFSNTPAPKAMLLFPLVLLVTVGLLSFLVITRQSASTNTQDSNSNSSSSTSQAMTTSSNNNNNGNSNGNQGNNANNGNSSPTTQSKDINKEAMSQVPISGFPENTCPAILVIEAQSNNYFAINEGKKYGIKKTDADWIKANCSDVETLNY